MVRFENKILIIGCGAVAQCTIPLLFKHIPIKPHNILVIDFVDNRVFIADAVQNGLIFIQEKITQDNFKTILGNYLNSGDICIDLANQVDTYDVLSWCLARNILYLNTNLNNWHNEPIPLYELYRNIKKLAEQSKNNSATAIISHGANPGLVSSFVKQALCDITQTVIAKPHATHDVRRLEQALMNNDYPRLAQALDIKTIHIAEQDSQSGINNHKYATEFLNTWSVIEFITECIANVEFSWGTHELKVPADGMVIDNIALINTRALNVKLRSWVPYQEIVGIVPPHDETLTIADYLTISNDTGVAYRPTVLFVYHVCPQADYSLKELESLNFVPQAQQRILKSELTSGSEKMGSLLMGNGATSWWTGSILTLEESNKILPNHNATVLQVSAGVIAALIEMIKKPAMGIRFPEDLDHEVILNHAKPYLGDFVSQPVQWKPHKDTRWQFDDFMI